MRLGLNIEYEGRNYDILELPEEAFVHMIPGLTEEQFQDVDLYFQPYWADATRRRQHLLQFAAQRMGASLDYLMLNRAEIVFTVQDLAEYAQEHAHANLGGQLS
ncbi:hypothetical protein D2Q93_08625 [Alicyclobacillaceae bacterium I2511]|jgi:hypothetical protein|nr:hypothetical protein D2Q93_08625 [Alicyclobacillaceae bacterium I2511]